MAAHRLPRRQAVGHLDDLVFPHAVEEQIGLCVLQDAGANGVVPVVVVGKAAHGCLHPADEDGRLGIEAADDVGVDDGGPVGALAHHPAGGVKVGGAALFGHGVVVDHRVHVPRRDDKAQAGPAELGEGGILLHIRLGENRHLVAGALQHPGDDGAAETGVVDIAVAADVDKVGLGPAPLLHLGAADGQKIVHGCPFRRAVPHSRRRAEGCPLPAVLSFFSSARGRPGWRTSPATAGG